MNRRIIAGAIGELVDPSRMTVGEFLADRIEVSAKPYIRPATYVRYITGSPHSKKKPPL